MRILITLLSIYLIVVAAGISIGAIASVGKATEPLTTSQAIVSVLLMLPLIALGVLVLREPLWRIRQ